MRKVGAVGIMLGKHRWEGSITLPPVWDSEEKASARGVCVGPGIRWQEEEGNLWLCWVDQAGLGRMVVYLVFRILAWPLIG